MTRCSRDANKIILRRPPVTAGWLAIAQASALPSLHKFATGGSAVLAPENSISCLFDARRGLRFAAPRCACLARRSGSDELALAAFTPRQK
jgi:hypothetical protein